MSRPFIALAAVFALGLILGGIDLRSATVTEKNERAAAEKKADVKPEERVWMRLPMECETWLAKCSAGQVCKPRYNCAADLTRREAK